MNDRRANILARIIMTVAILFTVWFVAVDAKADYIVKRMEEAKKDCANAGVTWKQCNTNWKQFGGMYGRDIRYAKDGIRH